MNTISKQVFYVLLSDGAKVPKKATSGSAGYDVYSPTESVLPAHSTVKIDLCIAVKPPPGTYLRTSCRSSLAINHNIVCPADVIDPDYTGSIHMCLSNLSSTDYAIKKHERIGSIVFERFAAGIEWTEVASLTETTRGSNGFGSTGKM